MKKFLSIVLSICIILSFTSCISYPVGEDSKDTSNNEELFGPYEVVRVVDGDTIIVNLDGEKTRVRFSNVDTPESVASKESGKVNTEEGVEASDYTKSLLPEGSKVYLEYDKHKIDKYDRVLAYVYLEDGETMIQDLLLKNGYAEIFYDSQNTKYTEHFEEILKGGK